MPASASPVTVDDMDVISCDRLTKRYGPTLAVNELGLTVPAGQVYGFLGLALFAAVATAAGTIARGQLATTAVCAGSMLLALLLASLQRADDREHAGHRLAEQILFPGDRPGRELDDDRL